MVASVILASFDLVPSGKGASEHILANAEALSSRYDVSLLTLGTEPLEGYRHRPVHLAEPNWLLRGMEFGQRATQFFQNYEFDAYHVRSPWEGLAVPAQRKLVYEVNGLYSIETGYHHPPVLGYAPTRRKLRALETRLIERSTKLATPSPVTARYLQDLGVPAPRITVIPNAPRVADQPAERSQHDRLRLCYVGTLAPWQGIAELIRVLPRMEVPFELTIVSGAARRWRRWIAKHVRKQGLADRVIYRPSMSLDRLGPFLGTQDIGLAPLIPCERNLVQGCMPIKILDYAAAGLPILAPEMECVREVLGPDYHLYRRYGRSGMTEGLAAFMGSAELRREMAELGQRRVQDHFSRAHHQERLLALYSEVLG